MVIRSSIHRIQSVHTPRRALRATSLFRASTHPGSIATGNVSRRMFAASAYRSDQPKTFENQSKLPRLPVPDLEASLEGYLKSLGPVLEEKVGPCFFLFWGDEYQVTILALATMFVFSESCSCLRDCIV